MNQLFTDRLQKIEIALNDALSMNINENWQSAAFGKLPEAVTPFFIQKLIEPNKNLIDLGGKRWRPLFLVLCYEYAKQYTKNPLTEKQAYGLTSLVEFCHTASLIHDDIEDSADLRRGKPAAHITYGVDTSINAASWLYFVAPVCLKRLNLTSEQQLNFYDLYTTELRRLHLGQAMDIYWHREKDVFPSMDEYKAMVKSKTGTLASLAAKIGFAAAGADESIIEKAGDIASNIGIGFQIIDDVQNLVLGNPGKKRGDDIVEGKKSLPVLKHISTNPRSKKKLAELMEIAAKEGIDSPAVEQTISLLNTSDCIKQSAEEGKKLIKDNCLTLASLYPENPSALLIVELFNSMIPESL